MPEIKELKAKIYALEKNCKTLSTIISLLINRLTQDEEITLKVKELEKFDPAFIMTYPTHEKVVVKFFRNAYEVESFQQTNKDLMIESLTLIPVYEVKEDDIIINNDERPDNVIRLEKLSQLIVNKIAEEVINKIAYT